MGWKRGLLHSPAYQDLHGGLSMTTQSVTASEYVWISSSTSSTLIVLSHSLCTRHCAKHFLMLEKGRRKKEKRREGREKGRATMGSRIIIIKVY